MNISVALLSTSPSWRRALFLNVFNVSRVKTRLASLREYCIAI